MALVNCGECSAQISDRANACPHCGNPMRGGGYAEPARQVVTIQETGKDVKILQIVAVIFMLAGLALIYEGWGGGGMMLGFGLIAVGFIGSLYAKVVSWWKYR
ncbi:MULTISPECIES: hypothetical protein [Burkholderia]|uniref:Zinc ribbon domain-containing protein n=1 Tax=Burkholderia gladioli TaxID=28095 RepID=A0AB38TN21_BURGA|nr:MULTISPECIES: hypothetical protein [Burkholderia]UWX68849.1 hypothetical protein NYZ96_11430 [Burkholderia gladioli]